MHIRNLVGEQLRVWEVMEVCRVCFMVSVDAHDLGSTWWGSKAQYVLQWADSPVLCIGGLSILSEFARGHRPFSLSNQSCN